MCGVEKQFWVYLCIIIYCVWKWQAKKHKNMNPRSLEVILWVKFFHSISLSHLSENFLSTIGMVIGMKKKDLNTQSFWNSSRDYSKMMKRSKLPEYMKWWPTWSSPEIQVNAVVIIRKWNNIVKTSTKLLPVSGKSMSLVFMNNLKKDTQLWSKLC